MKKKGIATASTEMPTIKSIHQAETAADLCHLDWWDIDYFMQYVPREVFDLIDTSVRKAKAGLLLEKDVIDIIRSGSYDEACESIAVWDDLGVFGDPVLAILPIADDDDRKAIARIIKGVSDDEKASLGIRWSPYWDVSTKKEAAATRAWIVDYFNHPDEVGEW